MATVPSALLTDLYQLTMACGYWRSGMAEQEAAFEMFFRRQPFAGGFTIAAGLADAITWLEAFTFTRDDLDYLASLEGNDGRPLFDPAFLAYLGKLRLACDIAAIPEGTVVFPHEPLVRVRGPLLHCQLIETALLNIINFQSLIATKAARVCLAAQGDPVIDFGLRRAQGPDGGFSASRAAFIGGCVGTSNMLAGKILGIPVRGTHAHSWVMAFDSETEAFTAYADALPNNAVFLVDTFDSLQGVRHAIDAGRRLRERGFELAGIRLDSGDLAYLSIQARRMLDEAGFPSAAIVASNDLDEHTIESLKQQGARINVWGVGTRLVTAFDDPALGGVYKLTGIRGRDGKWQPKIKLSEQAVKITLPGSHGVRRFREDGLFIGDAIYDIDEPEPAEWIIIDPSDVTRRKVLPLDTASEDLLVPIFRKGERCYDPPSLAASQARCHEQLAALHSGIKRFLNPHEYPAGLESQLHERKLNLIAAARHELGKP